MKVIDTKLAGVKIIEPDRFGDSRGFFLETYQKDRYAEIIGEGYQFVQDNHSRSSRGVLRGLHGQAQYPQGKLVRCARGAVFDVVVDVDPKSDMFSQWLGLLV